MEQHTLSKIVSTSNNKKFDYADLLCSVCLNWFQSVIFKFKLHPCKAEITALKQTVEKDTQTRSFKILWVATIRLVCSNCIFLEINDLNAFLDQIF